MDSNEGALGNRKFEDARLKRLQNRRGANGQPQQAAAPSVAEDRKTRFDRHQENVNTARRDTSAHDKRVAKQEHDREAWNRQGNSIAAGGTPLTDDLKKLKAASDCLTLGRTASASNHQHQCLERLRGVLATSVGSRSGLHSD